jgi:AraC-like DNA-binding protein
MRSFDGHKIAAYTDREFFHKLVDDCGRSIAVEPIICTSDCFGPSGPGISALVVDPGFGQRSALNVLLTLARMHHVPIVIYSSLTCLNICEIVEVLAERPHLSILGSAERPYSLIERHILRQSHSTPTFLLSLLARRIATASPLMALNLVGLFCDHHVRSVCELSHACAMSRRGLYRRHAELGLCPPHQLLGIAGIARAYAVLRYTNLSLSIAARTAGYDSSRTFSRHCVSLMGFAPLELRESAEEPVVAARLADGLTRGANDRFSLGTA